MTWFQSSPSLDMLLRMLAMMPAAPLDQPHTNHDRMAFSGGYGCELWLAAASLPFDINSMKRHIGGETGLRHQWMQGEEVCYYFMHRREAFVETAKPTVRAVTAGRSRELQRVTARYSGQRR